MIHYHGLPITPDAVLIDAYNAKHAMCSYANPGQIEIAAEVCQSVALDNGAFSAWKKGGALDVPGYTEWAVKWLKHPAVDWCLIPDIIDGSEHDNAAMVRDWPLHKALSVPVWHMHESLEYLAWLTNMFARIAIGSSGEYASIGNPRWWSRIHEAMGVLCDDGMPKVKIHGLRMLDPVVFSHIPFSSADSTNVARNIGIDKAWTGAYAPRSKSVRARILIDRIEGHGSAASWNGESAGVQQNLRLFG